MASYDDVGRIPRQAFVVSTSLLFALCIITLCARYYVRLAVQKEFGLDDAFLAFGTACLVAGMVILYINIDNIYFVEALEFTPNRFAFQPQDINRIRNYRKMVDQSLVLTWVAIISVKFAFLALFWRLIDRIPPLIKYWWVVVAYNLAIAGYGFSVYLVRCPQVICLREDEQRKIVRYSLSLIVLDVVGDLLILFIPCRLIWQVKIKLGQKAALACTLCLTAVVIIFTLTRAGGLVWLGSIDAVWEVFFQVIPAEVGLILVSMTAFRAVFVSRAARNQHSPQKGPSVWVRTRSLLRNLVDPRRWMSNYSKDTGDRKDGTMEGGFGREFPSIPGATITGIQTFINCQGEEPNSGTEFSTYPVSAVEEHGTFPSSKQVLMPANREQSPFHNQS